jgi:hypothetical protein
MSTNRTEFTLFADLYMELGLAELGAREAYLEAHPSALGNTTAAIVERDQAYTAIRARFAPQEAALFAAHGWTDADFQRESTLRLRASL